MPITFKRLKSAQCQLMILYLCFVVANILPTRNLQPRVYDLCRVLSRLESVKFISVVFSRGCIVICVECQVYYYYYCCKNIIILFLDVHRLLSVFLAKIEEV